MDYEADPLRIGGIDLDRADAFAKAKEYLSGKGNWGYPAYDGFDAGGDSDHLSDGDLLAPILLNVGIRIPTYSLAEKRAELERRLARVPHDKALKDADSEDIESLAELFAIIDEGLPGVRGTVLAKIMHRKRPLFIPLYDSCIWQCYVGVKDALVPRRERGKRRTWKEFVPLLAGEMIKDLNREDAWLANVAASAAGPVPVTPLRALDIVAWRAGRDYSADEGTDEMDDVREGVE
jgi:hypothetical protein